MPNEGATAINKATGERAVYTQGQWVKQKAGPPADASMRSRLSLGLGPMVEAEQQMSTMEAKGNPLNHDWGAAVIDSLDNSKLAEMAGLSTTPLAKKIGGQDYQNFVQSAKAFEAGLMPVMSGSAVTPSEAQRQIKAALPELGDSTETLARKSKTRRMMLNGAAKAMGVPLPYPDLPTYGINTDTAGQPADAPKVRVYNPQTGRLE